MTVTVIIIIAVIVVLAVLVLLLLGMRALSLGSRNDDYEDDYDHDEDGAPDQGGDDGEREPRGRARRSRGDGGGRSERRPRGRRQRGVDWDDDDSALSDNGFWSSLSDGDGDADAEEPAEPVRSGRRGVEPTVTHYEYEDDDEYEEYDEEDEYEDDPAPAPGGSHAPTRAVDAAPVADALSSAPSGPDPTNDLAVLASLGQGGPGPQAAARDDDRPETGRAVGTGSWPAGGGEASAPARQDPLERRRLVRPTPWTRSARPAAARAVRAVSVRPARTAPEAVSDRTDRARAA